MTIKRERFGNVTVTVDNGAADLAGLAPAALAGIMVQVIARHSIEQVDRAKGQWPDKGRKLSPWATGESRRAFRVRKTTDRDSGKVNVKILNDARNDDGELYAFLIKSRVVGTGADGKGLNAWQELIARPMRLREQQIAADIASEVSLDFGDLI